MLATQYECVSTIPQDKGFVRAIAALPTGRIASVSSGEIRVRDRILGPVLSFSDNFGYVNRIEALSSGHIAFVCRKNVNVLDVTDGRLLVTFEGHTGSVRCILELADGRVITGSDDWTVKFWDMTGRCLRTLAIEHGPTSAYGGISCFAVLGGRLVTGALNEFTLKLVDLAEDSLAEVVTFRGHSNSVWCVASVSGGLGGRILSGGRDRTLRLWDLAGRCLAKLPGHAETVYTLVVLPDGRVASASVDSTIKIWDVIGCRCLQTLEGHGSGVEALAVLPSGDLVSGSFEEIKVWSDTQRHGERRTAKSLARQRACADVESVIDKFL